MLEKARTALWFLRRPRFWAQAVELGSRKLRPDQDSVELRQAATEWARKRAEPLDVVLGKVGLADSDGCSGGLDEALLAEGEERAMRAAVPMGGPGDLGLLYAAVVNSRARRIVETGVAYGWSSLAILAGLERVGEGRLVSVDMPYPKAGNEPYVGIVVPERLRGRWELIREPDRNGLRKAIRSHGGQIDLCHYDSDKSWWGRQYAYPLLWDALAPGGFFISDDIQDNFAFAEFVDRAGSPFGVTECEGKFVGIVRKGRQT